jgi:hypothetical protein
MKSLAWLLFVAATMDFSSSMAFAARKRSAGCLSVQVGPQPQGRKKASDFSAAAVKDLRIEILLTEDAATRPVQVKLYTPRGRLYQILDAVADSGQTMPNARSKRRERRFEALLPVAGTQITAHALYGRWRAEVYLDGASTACSRPVEFVLAP